MRRSALLLLALSAAGCTAVVDVETEPFSVSIPASSVGVAGYAEVAVDLPPEAQGNVDVKDASATLSVVNPSSGSTMTLSVRISTEGRAEPGEPLLYTQANVPSYFADAALILGPKAYAPGTTTGERIDHPALARALGRERLWLIVSNTVTTVLGDPFPLELRAEDIVVRASVERTFSGLAGALELSGL